MHTGEVKLDYLCVEEVTFRGTSEKHRGTVFIHSPPELVLESRRLYHLENATLTEKFRSKRCSDLQTL